MLSFALPFLVRRVCFSFAFLCDVPYGSRLNMISFSTGSDAGRDGYITVCVYAPEDTCSTRNPISRGFNFKLWNIQYQLNRIDNHGLRHTWSQVTCIHPFCLKRSLRLIFLVLPTLLVVVRLHTCIFTRVFLSITFRFLTWHISLNC